MRAQTFLTTTAAFAAGALFDRLTHSSNAQNRKSDLFTSDNLAERALHRRAMEAVIWGMSAVNFDVMLQAMIRDAKAKVNQIVFWSKPSDWKNQTLTPNTDVLYIMPFMNTKEAGPMVLEIPPADGGVIVGSIMDAWQRPLEDVGPAGLDKGQGAKYLVLPPNYREEVADEYFPLPCDCYQSYALLRAIPSSGSDADIAKAARYLKKIRLYPLAQADHPTATSFTDASRLLFDANIPYDLRYFQSLHRLIQIEPWLERDKAMIHILRGVGIEKGKPFKPIPRTQDILLAAISEARTYLEERFVSQGTYYYTGKQWKDVAEPVVIESKMTFETHNDYALDSRATLYSFAFSSIKHPGKGQYYLIGYNDKNGQRLTGSNNYRLTVPSQVPVHQYWSATVYDMATHALIRDVSCSSRSSLNPGLQTKADGSVDLYFGPKAPEGKESNWIPTKSGDLFEILFRFYGPEKAVFDKTWQLHDIEPLPRPHLF